MESEFEFELGKYKWIGPYSFFLPGEDGELASDMISPIDRINLLSDMHTVEDFVRVTWMPGEEDDQEFINFWKGVRALEHQKL